MINMLQRLVDDLQTRAGTAARLTTLASAAGLALLIATSFFAAAAFVFVQQQEGTVVACLAAGTVFLGVALIAAGCYMAKKRQERLRLEQAAREAAQSAKSTASTILSDPAALAVGLQLVRMIGVKRLIPLLAIGGVALGVMASQRHRADASPAEASPAE
jgi:hypothetical protein